MLRVLHIVDGPIVSVVNVDGGATAVTRGEQYHVILQVIPYFAAVAWFFVVLLALIGKRLYLCTLELNVLRFPHRDR